MIDIIKEVPEDEYSYSFNFLKEKIEKATTEEELEKLNEDLASDFEAGNLNQNEFCMLSCLLSDQEYSVVSEMLHM